MPALWTVLNDVVAIARFALLCERTLLHAADIVLVVDYCCAGRLHGYPIYVDLFLLARCPGSCRYCPNVPRTLRCYTTTIIAVAFPHTPLPPTCCPVTPQRALPCCCPLCCNSVDLDYSLPTRLLRYGQRCYYDFVVPSTLPVVLLAVTPI